MPTTYAGLVTKILEIVNLLILFIFGFAFVYLMWKIIDTWILNSADESKREEGKKYAMSAVLVFVLGISAWGIVTIIKEAVFGT